MRVSFSMAVETYMVKILKYVDELIEAVVSLLNATSLSGSNPAI